MIRFVSPGDKPLIWRHGEIKTPPFSEAARIEAGYLLRLLQKGQALGLPHSRPMPVVGRRCHVYRADTDAIVILAVFPKTTRATPKRIIDACIRRLRESDRA
jgi:hypothetical protein